MTRKIFAIFLSLITIFSALTGCTVGGGETPEQDSTIDTTPAAQQTTAVPEQTTVPSEPTVSAEASSWTLIRSALPSTAIMTELMRMKAEIDALTGGNMGFSGDSLRGDEADNAEAYEIIVGNTSRSQSAEVSERLKDNTFAIEKIGNKIVIVASSDNLISAAVNYFVENFVVPYNKNDGMLVVPETISYLSPDFSGIKIVDGGQCPYTIIFSEELDITVNSNNNHIDYVAQSAKDVREKIKSLTNEQPSLKTDWVKPGYDTAALYEILVGETDREEYFQALSQYDVDEYGVSFINNKIVIAGWSDTTVGLACKLFCSLLESGVVEHSDGTKSIELLKMDSYKGSLAGAKTDIPVFDNATFSGSSTCDHDDLLYYYTDATAEEFKAYCDKLSSQGYKTYMENEITGNLYATYLSSDESTMLHAFYTDYDNCVRIVTGPNDDQWELPKNVEGPESYTKITETKITQMTLDYASGNFGMCYIITLEDGSFIIFDGGGRSGNKDHIRLYNLLNKLNERPDNKIVIAAWILTHSHQDHYIVFENFCLKYGSKVTIEQYVLNVPDTVVRYNSGNPGGHIDNDDFTSARRAAGNFPLVKPYTGMKFWVRNAEIEVLYTQESFYPQKFGIFNDSTMVTRMTVGGQTIMWLGDIQNKGSDVICDMYGSYIKSDMVQVAHHGVTGGTKELYGLIDPAIAFWPTSASSYASQIAGTNNSGYYAVDYYLAKQLNVVDIFIAQPHNICITLPYTPGSGKQVKIAASAG